MRIVAGRWRGRAIAAGEGRAIRPTTDRARETLFNILAHGPLALPLNGARVLDAFAGTGALGLEALSRGAAHATFIEQARPAQDILRANIAALGAGAQSRILARSALDPGAADAPYDLIFMDPPYGQGLAAPALAALAERGWIAPDALMVVETGADESLAPPQGFLVLEARRIGPARFFFVRRARPGL